MKSNENIILVIGDVMLDRYIFGNINRVSPEASCPIFEKNGKVSSQLGAASNVAVQIRNAGFYTYIVGQVGHDAEGYEIREILRSHKLDCSFLFNCAPKTTVKERYISNANQQVFRIDYEEKKDLPIKHQKEILNLIYSNADSITCIVLSDYDKGVLTTDFCQQLIQVSTDLGIPTVVDVKKSEIAKYSGATFIKGNLKEFSELANNLKNDRSFSISSAKDKLPELKNSLRAQGIIITCGSQGAISIDAQNRTITHKANQRIIFDVTGAGDIVTAYIGIGIGKGISFEENVDFANKAAGLSVSSLGNSLVNPSEVYQDEKIILPEVVDMVRQGRRVVFTNGCFDVLHVGHIDLLNQAKELGDILIVGLNSDASVKKLKGETRPFNCFHYRAKMLSALNSVNYIIEFNEETPIELIKRLRPEVLVKGGDYNIDEIVGYDIVSSYGGTVTTIPFKFNTSTSKILSYGE